MNNFTIDNIIKNNLIITLHRGDYLQFPLYSNIDTLFPTPVVIGDNDKIYFAILEPNQMFEVAIVRKVFTNENKDENGNIIISIDTNDTINLLPMTYFYEVKLEKVLDDNSTQISTIVPRTKFNIIE